MSLNTFWEKRAKLKIKELSHGVCIGYGVAGVEEAAKLGKPCEYAIWDEPIWDFVQHITTDEVFSRLGQGVTRCRKCIERYNEWAAWVKKVRPNYHMNHVPLS